MKNSAIQQFFNPYADDPKTLRRLAIRIQLIIFGTAVGLIFFVDNASFAIILAGLVGVILLLSLRGAVWPGQIVTPLAVAAVSAIFMLEGSGIHDIAIVGMIGSVVVAGLLLGAQGLSAFGLLAILIFLGIGIAELSGRFIPPTPAITTLEEMFIGPLIIGAIVLTISTLVNRLRQIARHAHDNELSQISNNAELLQLKQSLEKRVAERTADLERRADQMETIAATARSITAMQELEELLPSICQVVSEKFGLYHTAIFLLDERGEYAILQAANSKGGQEMLKRGHHLRVGASGIVGTVAGQGKTRIALDVGADAAYLNNPDLPETRSEMALPLKVGSQTIGVLDVQSREFGAFKEEDAAVLGILANQISVAIENARLFSQTRQALTDSQAIYQDFIQQNWARFSRTVKHTGYSYDGIKATPAQAAPPSLQANTINLPIKIRGLTVGNITVQSHNPSRAWSQSEINLAEAAAERAGLAIENFRLLTEAQRRAAKERAVGEITARIGSSVDVREIMQTTVEELGRALTGSEVILQFQKND